MKYSDKVFKKIISESINSRADEITKKIQEKISMDEDVDTIELEKGADYEYRKSEEDEPKVYTFMRRGTSKGPFHFKNKLGKDLIFGKRQVEKMKKKVSETKLEETKLKGNQYKIDKNKNGKIDSGDFKILRSLKKSEIDEKLYGKQKNIDKNNNGKIDAEDFKMLRKKSKKTNEGTENRFKKIYNEFTKRNITENSLEGFCGGNINNECIDVAKKSGNPELIKKAIFAENIKDLNKMKKDSVSYELRTKDNQFIHLTENEMVNLIEKLVKEEQGKSKGMTTYSKIHNKDKAINTQGVEDSIKKISNYVKQGSKGNFKANPDRFPKGNGELEKMEKHAYVPSEYVKDYVDAFAYPGQTNLRFDEIKPNDEWIEMNLKGDSKTGNAQTDKDGNALGNVVPSEVGEKFYKNYEDNIYGAEQSEASYKRQSQPVDVAGNTTQKGKLTKKNISKVKADKILNNLDESVERYDLINEEMDNIKKLITYSQKTQ